MILYFTYKLDFRIIWVISLKGYYTIITNTISSTSMTFRQMINIFGNGYYYKYNDYKYNHVNFLLTYAFSIISIFKLHSIQTLSLVLVFIFGLSVTLSDMYYSEESSIISSVYARPQASPDGPTLNDPNLIPEVVYQGLKSPTAMAFLGPDDILVLGKKDGSVQRIVNGQILPEPLLQVDVNSKDERGLLGIAISSGSNSSNLSSSNSTSISISPKNVFLFFTESGESKEELPAGHPEDGESKEELPAGHRVYKYELADNNTKLINPTLLLDLPAWPGDSHVGGVIDIGPDNNLYLTKGDQRHSGNRMEDSPDSQTKAQNYIDGQKPDGRAGILRITQDGEVVGGKGILGDEHPLNKYYAYGIKNSFGFDFDPVTGNLWVTENGPRFGDEINLVEPGFNSGWAFIQGFWTLDDEYEKVEKLIIPSLSNETNDESENVDYGLVDFDGKGKYSHPEFVWDVAPTAITFLDSDTLGQQYENDMFVGDAKKGNLYHFELDEPRTGLLLDGTLADKIGSKDELQQVVFGSGFGVITDIKVGPADGYLYILTFDRKMGTIYKIGPAANN